MLGAKPVLLVTTVSARPFVTLAQLRQAHAKGKVRYVVTESTCTKPNPAHPACAPAMLWVYQHARDVTAQTGLPPNDTGFVYDLSQPRKA